MATAPTMHPHPVDHAYYGPIQPPATTNPNIRAMIHHKIPLKHSDPFRNWSEKKKFVPPTAMKLCKWT